MAVKPSGRQPGNYLVPIYRKCRRGIVDIQAVREKTEPAFPQSFFDFMPPPERRQEMAAFGTGFVVNRKGWILTSDHVVKNAHEIQIGLHNGKKCSAKVIWNDKEHDIALLEVEGAPNLRPLPLGSSQKSEVGEFVLSIGNPLGLENSLTSGVISRKHKSVAVSDKDLDDVIQTDCAINPGSSGGPLINLKGEVIGMNAFMAKNKNGLGFALGIDGIKSRIREYLD